MPTLNLFEEQLSTPIGELIIHTDEQQQARAVDWLDHRARLELLQKRQYLNTTISIQPLAHHSAVYHALEAYFAGDQAAFKTIQCTVNGTEFQKEAWSALLDIPYGNTWSYAQQAQYIQRPKAVRAIGSANGANPISIIIPCHRVIGSDQSLTGYGGGVDRKNWLLEHEKRNHA